MAINLVAVEIVEEKAAQKICAAAFDPSLSSFASYIEHKRTVHAPSMLPNGRQQYGRLGHGCIHERTLHTVNANKWIWQSFREIAPYRLVYPCVWLCSCVSANKITHHHLCQREIQSNRMRVWNAFTWAEWIHCNCVVRLVVLYFTNGWTGGRPKRFNEFNTWHGVWRAQKIYLSMRGTLYSNIAWTLYYNKYAQV